MHGWQSSDRNNAPLKTNNCLCCAPTHIAVAAFYFNSPYAELAIVTERPMQPLVKAPIGFDAPLSTNLNAGNSANDRGLEQANCANGFEGEDNDLDYVLYRKGRGMRLIPLSRVCLNVVLRPDRAAPNDGDESSPGHGAVAQPDCIGGGERCLDVPRPQVCGATPDALEKAVIAENYWWGSSPAT
jgi:hypothetical protein